MKKVEVLNEYIKECENVIKENNNQKAFELQERILKKFSGEIKSLYKVVDIYLGIAEYKEQNLLRDCIQNIRNIKDELEYFKEALEKPIAEPKNSSQIFNFSQNQNISDSANSNITTNYELSIEKVMQKINEISNEVLDYSEKEELEDKLSAIDVVKNGNDKIKIASKVGSVLKYIADKGIEVGLAVLPYILEVLKSNK